MSSGSMFVRFPDGEIKVGTYYGTSDTIGWTLWSQGEDKYKVEKSTQECDADTLPLEDVCVVPLYGGDWHFYTKASRNFMHPEMKPYVYMGDLEYLHEDIDGLPDWYTAIQAEQDPFYEVPKPEVSQ
jgi:hypothetical protein